MSNTKHLLDELSAYLDNELSASERRRVEAHLRTCAVCRNELASLSQTIQLVQALPPMRASRSFTLSNEQAARVRPTWQPGWMVNALRAMTTAAAVLLIAVCSADFMALNSFNARSGAAPLPAVMSAPQQPTANESADQTKALPATTDSAPAAGSPATSPAAAPLPVVPSTAPFSVQATVPAAAATNTGAAGAQPPSVANTPTANPTVRQVETQATATPSAIPSERQPGTQSVVGTPAASPSTATDTARTAVLTPTIAPSPARTNTPTAIPTNTPTLQPTAVPTRDVALVLPTVQPAAPAGGQAVLQATPTPMPSSSASEAYNTDPDSQSVVPALRLVELGLVSLVLLGGAALLALRITSR